MRNGLTCSEAGKLGAIAALDTINKQKQDRIDTYHLNPIKCLYCGNIIPYEKRLENKFCNHVCCATYHNKDRKVITRCLMCNKEIIWGKKYCSRQCHRDFNWKNTKTELLELGCDTSSLHHRAKRYLIEINNGSCQICNLSEWNGVPIPLVLDHINGHSEDGSLSNLRVICNNCDALTDTYKGKNVGNGRAKRRQRYKEGKSY